MQVTAISSGTSKRVIAVGRLEWQKGYDKLIRIWKDVYTRHPNWQLDIYGEGTQEYELTNTIKELNIRDSKD